MRSIFFGWVLLIASGIGAQNYSVSLIPDSLLKNAHAVKRMEELKVSIKSINKVVVTNKYAITVLDEQGEFAAEYSSGYSSMRSLGNIEGNLFDANGKKLNR